MADSFSSFSTTCVLLNSLLIAYFLCFYLDLLLGKLVFLFLLLSIAFSVSVDKAMCFSSFPLSIILIDFVKVNHTHACNKTLTIMMPCFWKTLLYSIEYMNLNIFHFLFRAFKVAFMCIIGFWLLCFLPLGCWGTMHI